MDTLRVREGNPRPIIGLIGGIGAGKSRVSQALEKYGAVVLNADRIGHEAYEDPAVLSRVMARWGERIADAAGQIDRRKLGAIVFASPVERVALEHIVFPWIEARIARRIRETADDPAVRLIVLDAAVMLEAGWGKICDRIVYVHAPRAIRLDRIERNRGWSLEDVAVRESAQYSLTYKATVADAAIDNSGSEALLERQVDQLIRGWFLA